MKIVLLLLLLVPVVIFQSFIFNEIILDYKAKKNARKSKARSRPGAQKNKVYYRVK
ncbi:MAG TPA: hypothetical protein VK071_04500 [Tissierellales bacterium]|nr:hypothetical protein [Tissierellales bacterium]